MPQPRAIIYFDPAYGDMAKDIAARVRDDIANVQTTMVWGTRVRDERDMEGGAHAVIIQRSLDNASLIETMYREFAVDCEIHFVGDDGEFEETDEDGGDEGTGTDQPPDSEAPQADAAPPADDPGPGTEETS